jgi:hypothetical protein
MYCGPSIEHGPTGLGPDKPDLDYSDRTSPSLLKYFPSLIKAEIDIVRARNLSRALLATQLVGPSAVSY